MIHPNTMHYRRVGIAAYQLTDIFLIQTIITGYDVETDLIRLHRDGLLLIQTHYAWDGPTAAKNTRSFVAGSCVHDVFCELINLGLLPRSEQCKADEQMAIINDMEQIWSDGVEEKEVEMSRARQLWTYLAVRFFQHSKRNDPAHRAAVYTLQLHPTS